MAEKEAILSKVMQCVGTYISSDIELQPSTDLLEDAGLDSASMLNILMQLEPLLGVQLNAADLTFDHFHSCQTLADYFAERS